MKVSCLLDTFTDQKGKARMKDLIQEKIIKDNKVIFFDEFTSPINPSEIEDMFLPEEYIALFNAEFSEFADINVGEISPNYSVIQQINKIIGVKRFNHYRPANYLSKNPQIIESLSDITLNKFSEAFERINKALK